jgi:hypothetical protein
MTISISTGFQAISHPRLAGARDAERAADIDDLGDEERQRQGKEEFDEPNLDQLRNPGSNPVKCQHTPPDEPQHTHGWEE